MKLTERDLNMIDFLLSHYFEWLDEDEKTKEGIPGRGGWRIKSEWHIKERKDYVKLQDKINSFYQEL